ncbi:MAG: hypothetical protein ACLSHC_10740 [Bilophila wadsworthia]
MGIAINRHSATASTALLEGATPGAVLLIVGASTLFGRSRFLKPCRPCVHRARHFDDPIVRSASACVSSACSWKRWRPSSSSYQCSCP